MILTITNPQTNVREQWIAHFTHQSPATIYRLRPYAMKTLCTVHKAPCPKKARPCGAHDPLVGIAYCSLKDNFVRWKGRKLAFTRAIDLLSREMRRELWAAFFTYEEKKGGKRKLEVSVARKNSSLQEATPQKEGVATT